MHISIFFVGQADDEKKNKFRKKTGPQSYAYTLHSNAATYISLSLLPPKSMDLFINIIYNYDYVYKNIQMNAYHMNLFRF